MISWNEIRSRALAFSKEWEGETREDAERQSFWNDFFNVFGIHRRTVARYEERVSRLGKGDGFIDIFWPGTLIGEHKTAGKDLDSAFEQAGEYFDGLKEEERPRYIIVSDYRHIRLYDLEAEGGIRKEQFALKELPVKIRLFGFMAGYEERVFKDEDPVNAKAVKKIARLYEALDHSLYQPELLKKLLVRLVFCFFADDSGIFPKRDMLKEYFQYFTKEDGSDFGAQLGSVFQTLNTPEAGRQTTLHEDLAQLPYVNGGLFSEPLPLPFFDSDMRKAVIEATDFDWGAVSPAIFGSMFQSVMDDKARHDLGAHYTSEKNILRVINPLFMDGLRAELEACGKNPQKLRALQDKLSRLKFLDPACGCGNFLVVAYRELRLLELDIISLLHAGQIASAQPSLSADILNLSKLSVEQMHGIEIEDFPALIAQLALWLTDHQMNVKLGYLFGAPSTRLPLTSSGHITHGNALQIDWNTVIKKENNSYIFGNPPFLGYKQQGIEQKRDIDKVCAGIQGTGVLDYVAGWYFKAAQYIQDTGICCAFVSTNSITQGEQVAALWQPLTEKFGIKINFAHRTFKWTNEAKGKAAVYCVIIGFSLSDGTEKIIFDYEDVRGEPHEIKIGTINPYLVSAPAVFLKKRSAPISPEAPRMIYGSEPRDGGMLILTSAERNKVIEEYPVLSSWIRKFVNADDFLNSGVKWCYWLVGAPPEILASPPLQQRLTAVRAFRELSKQKAAHEAAGSPALFVSIRHTDNPYLLIPIVSSETRKYIPMGYMPSDTITSNANFMLPNAAPYHFGVLESEMHMAWMRQVCGRLKSDYRYSNTIVYNNFPWPENPTAEFKKIIEEKARVILEVRSRFPNSSLALLYGQNTMPKELFDAHKALDKAVDNAYGIKGFENELKRLEFLFVLYQKYIARNGK